MASFCMPGRREGVWRRGAKKKKQAYFGRLLLTVNNRRGQNSNSTLLPNGGPITLNLFFLSLCLFSLPLSLKKIFFREELAMRLDLTEARVQVSGSLVISSIWKEKPVTCKSNKMGVEGGKAASSNVLCPPIKCPGYTALDNSRWYASLIEDQRLLANLRQ